MVIATPGLTRIALSGGCYWCMEAVCEALLGVEATLPGFVTATGSAPHGVEAVRVDFDPVRLPLEALVAVHLHTHHCTSRHARREAYPSAIYTLTAAQGRQAEACLARLQAQFAAPLVTRVLPYATFRPAALRFRHYCRAHPEPPFCRRWVRPKLEVLRRRFPELLEAEHPPRDHFPRRD